MRMNNCWMGVVTCIVALLLGAPLLAGDHGIEGKDIAVWMAIPFAGILLSIAILPLVAPHFWHHHFGKVSLGWSLIGGGILFFMFAGKDGVVTGKHYGVGDVVYELGHIMLLDYVPFLILLLGLFTIAGGIRLKGSLRGSPKLNALMLLIGTALASWMGTTGAAMLMVRPLLRANAWRKRKVHIVIFFIFLVCNIGGSLTPLGDPPLFLGFLRGVSFTWTFALFPYMVLLTVALIAIFFVFDTWLLRKEEHKTPPVAEGEKPEKLGVEGGINFLLLAGLIGAILLGSHLGSTEKGGMGKGTLYNKETHDKFIPVIEDASKRADSLHKALIALGKNPAEVEGHYVAAVGLTKKLSETELPHAGGHEGDSQDKKDGHEHSHEAGGGEADHSHDKHDHARGGAPHDAHGHHMAGEEGTFIISKEHKGLPQGSLPYVGGLEARADAAREAGKSVKVEDLRPLVLLDYQRAVSETNRLRAIQSHDSTKALSLGGTLPGVPWANLVRDLLILLLAFVSWKVTKIESRKANGFTWFPIIEVAKLFAGIFICIIPALKILQAGVDGELAGVVASVTNPETGGAINSMYFWLTGILSSFLDNAPTYLVFFNTAGGDASFLMGEGATTLLAISMGAVFMGANTYIGNAPNFMVKSIAEENDIKMPSFFGYMLWSIVLLVPLFVVVMFMMEALAKP